MPRARYAHTHTLTGAELAVLRLLAQGEQHPGVATARGVTLATVREQSQAAREKLQARTTTHAVAIALRCGLIQ